MSAFWTWYAACNVWFVVVLAVMMAKDKQHPHGAWVGALAAAVVFGTLTTVLLWLAVVEVTVRLFADVIGALAL